jgi:ABC-type uncharacterized transport system ATPase component
MHREKDELTAEALDGQNGQDLPERQAMSLIDANVAAAALSVLSDDSTAVADPQRSTEVAQSQS